MSLLYQHIAQILDVARQQVAKAANVAMVQAYWQIGRAILQEEQQGRHRAEYGANMMAYLAIKLTEQFGSGFKERNLYFMKQFYVAFPNLNALRTELSWTHYRSLLRVDNSTAREFYLQETISNGWSTRALDRQINTLYYERLLASEVRGPLVAEMHEKTDAFQLTDILKDPYVLEFLQLQENAALRESDLEQALMFKLQQFLLELGKGFAFVARQKRISTETKHFYLDLVFYNYLLKCFVLIDLKTRELRHEDVGQMDMYVRLYEDKYKAPDDNPTIGLILCTHKDYTMVKYSVLHESVQRFASRYMLFLPSEAELRAELERERAMIEHEQNNPDPTAL